jgi:hypothetical protein
MKRQIRFVALLMVAATSITGCATLESTRVIATPWGAGGIHSFRPAKSLQQPRAQEVDAQIAQLLATPEQPEGAEVQVAAR